MRNGCGKKSGCVADIVLPYGKPKQVTDNSVGQKQSGSGQGQTSK